MLRDAIDRHHPGSSDARRQASERLSEVCQNYLDRGLGDDNALQRLCSGSQTIYWQQLSEILLGSLLEGVGFELVHRKVGPDFLIDMNGKRIWIEVITPEPVDLPAAWSASSGEFARTYPHQEILLRWTSAIKAKAEVLIGPPDQPAGYLANGVVDARDCYVIAVNARLLRGCDGLLPAVDGISGLPFAVEATFGVGPLQIRIDRRTLEASEPEHQERFLIEKPKGRLVPADTFLDPRFASVSAIWAVDVDERSAFDGSAKMYLVHNPGATNPVPQGALPAQKEYVARPVDEDRYQLACIDGRSPPLQEDAVLIEK